MSTKKEVFPPAFTDEGGVQIPYIPAKEEMENCAFAKRAGVECPRKEFVFGAPSQQRSCGSCQHHPHKKMFVVAKEVR